MNNPDSGTIELRLLMEAIYLKYSYDFRDYSGASQKRRVQHALQQMDCASISALQARVLHDPDAFMQLLQYLTIPTSEMFRDPGYFLALVQGVGVEHRRDRSTIVPAVALIVARGDRQSSSQEDDGPFTAVFGAASVSITFHRSRRDAGTLKTELTDVKGLGPITADKLLNKFKSVKKIRELTDAELVAEVGKAKAKVLQNYFAQHDAPSHPMPARQLPG